MTQASVNLFFHKPISVLKEISYSVGMPLMHLFPTAVLCERLKNSSSLNRKLLEDIRTISQEDELGIRWSLENYQGGYTSYSSLNDLHHRFPSFQEFESRLTPHIQKFGRSEKWATRGMRWVLTSTWANIMNKGSHHASHLHPHSSVSGVYYVSIPNGSALLKIEDPRMTSLMSAPIRPIIQTVEPKEGMFVAFESWVRHEVAPHQNKKPRISISFNYSLERAE